MTHDELSDKIYWHWKNADDAEFFGLSGYRKALRAVVELHKPDMRGDCDVCTWTSGGGFVVYPCPTIRAIEKELR